MNSSHLRLRAVPVAVAALLGGLWSTAYAAPVTFGNITLDATYALGGTYSGATPPANVNDGMTASGAYIYTTPSGADYYYYTSDAASNSAFFHTYGFTGASTYFGARASGTGSFFAATRATYSQVFTNNSAAAQAFNFAFGVSDGDLGITGIGAGFADLLLNVKINGVSVSRSRTTITQSSSGVVTCDDSSEDVGSMSGYMNCASPTSASAQDGGGVYNVSSGLIGAGESFTLDYDIIATVSGNLSQGTRLEMQCTGYGGYGNLELGVAQVLAVDTGYGGGAESGQTCQEVLVSVPGEVIARSGDPFGPQQNTGLLSVTTSSDVPEPASVALVGLGLAGLAAARRRRQGSDKG